MLYRVVAGGFKNVEETDYIAVYVGVGMGNRIGPLCRRFTTISNFWSVKSFSILSLICQIHFVKCKRRKDSQISRARFRLTS